MTKAQDLENNILAVVRQDPGVSLTMISEHFGRAYGTIRSAIRRLEMNHWVRLEKGVPRQGESPQLLAYAMTPEERLEAMAPDTCSTLLTELEELRKFKARAVALYPQLDVSEAVLKARAALAAKWTYDSDYADSLLAGHHDDSPAIQALIEAYQQAA